MSEELGRIEKPAADEFRQGRKLYYVPQIYPGKEPPAEYLERYNRYWSQVEEQVSGLETKIGNAAVIYHEMVVVGGEEGSKAIGEMNEKCGEMLKKRLEKGTRLEPVEDSDLLAELMDWGMCLSVGLQSHRVLNTIYGSYTEAGKKRNEHIARRIDETLEKGGAGILFMREGHQVQFAPDIQVFYVSPPALDELKRWLRDRESQEQQEKTPEGENND